MKHNDSAETNRIEPVSPEPGWVERNGFSDWALALIWIITALVFFQVTAGVVATMLLFAVGGMEPGTDLMELLYQRLDLLFIGNSTGQILFLGIASWKVAGLHVSRAEKPRFMRFRFYENTPAMTLWALLLFIVVQPAVWYLGYLNTLVPLPDSFLDMQESQQQMIENFLRSDGVLLMALFNIAVVPAICEEVMFRGYVQGSMERSWGAWPAILVSGLLFGLFHLQLANLLPLATLGVLLALVTWLSGSLVPAIAAHFINNGSAVLIATWFPELAFAELSPETAPPLWTLLASVVLSTLIIRRLFRQGKGRAGDEPATG